jgi:hypothetical protein
MSMTEPRTPRRARIFRDDGVRCLKWSSP